ncbi:hypothetical protein K431DRAFT_140364 [Polychaeton citri CBS 116435]|uniref:F-box domain-containing protein n=1 Tax=Polychaeton citri CBS 116435 TaxID=1314669 RepID=A0A9P4Q2G5_9PEZI|nr:hypothetical protein K431DRAFT_140364 [Polychaeton citri CBS 116435]
MMEPYHTGLLGLLSNSLILRQTAPYLPPIGLLNLAATSKYLRELIYSSPEAWRYLNLTGLRFLSIDSSPLDIGGISWRAERMDESLTEDDFYAGPLRGIFGRLHQKDVLRNVQTLILDGLSVPADLVREIVAEDRYNVKILSIREAKNLNQTKLRQVLRYITRPTRAEETPRLKALYVFGSKDGATRGHPTHKPPPSPVASAAGVMAAEGAQIGAEWNHKSSKALSSCLDDDEQRWYMCNGRVIKTPSSSEWADTLQACQGIIAFDAVLCRGPRHDITRTSAQEYLSPAVASIALGPTGCQSCGSCPEGSALFGVSSESTLPLIAPPPSHASRVRPAQRPTMHADRSFPPLFLRCEVCLAGRWCERCNRWWCEDCYHKPSCTQVHLHSDGDQQQMSLQRERDSSSPSTNGARVTDTAQIKVYSKLCVEHCLVSEMMYGAGSNGMWG